MKIRFWHILKNGKEYQCEVVSINALKRLMWLRIGVKTFKVQFLNQMDFEYAKRGEWVMADASNKKQNK
jgi:hypothetical protein